MVELAADERTVIGLAVDITERTVKGLAVDVAE